MTDFTGSEPATGLSLARGPGASLSIRLDLLDGRSVTMPLGPAECVALTVDVYFGSRDGAGLRRVDVEIKPAPNGGLEIGIAVPAELRGVVLALVKALGVPAGKGL